MGYDAHITRRTHWFDDDGPTITLQEWLACIAQDPELYADAREMASPGDALWIPRPGVEMGLWHQDNRVVTKNPGEGLLVKMYQIAQSLDARVLGDENEEYGADGQMIAARVDLAATHDAAAVSTGTALPSAAASHAPVPAGAPARRFTAVKILVSVVVWLLCLPGLYFHVFLGLVSPVNLLGGALAGQPATAVETITLIGMSASLACWGILAWMNIAWIRNCPVHWIWPLLGTTLALAWQAPFGFIPSLFVAPGVALAIYLSLWHLWRWQHRRTGSTVASTSRAP